MKTIIDKLLLQNLRNEINIAVTDVAARHAVTLRATNASFDPVAGTATFKLEVLALGEGGAARDMPAELFLQNCALVGLKPEYLGRPITLQGGKFTVAGFKPKARKNCILIKDAQTGKNFVTDAATVRRQLEKS